MLHALTVGVDRYLDPSISSLRYARRDAASVADLLQQNLHPSEASVRRLLDAQATQRAISIAIGEELPRACRPGDVVLLYFAGHGSPETDGPADGASRFLIPHDAEKQHLFTTGIQLGLRFAEWLDRLADAALVVTIIDACFSGAPVAAAPGTGVRTFMGPRLQRARTRGKRRPPPLSLEAFEFGEGRLVLSASRDDEPACEDASVRHGVFTHYLLKALGEPLQRGGTITVAALFDRLRRETHQHMRGRQTPVLQGLDEYARLPILGPG